MAGGGIGGGNGSAQFAHRDGREMIDAGPVALQNEVTQTGALLVADQAQAFGRSSSDWRSFSRKASFWESCSMTCEKRMASVGGPVSAEPRRTQKISSVGLHLEMGRIFFRVSSLVLTVTSCLGQQPVKHRPTIGLALEGGGALGLAHVGLLEWFERHHIPVDYIAGSSMGGLVAGFYASGMTADEMHTTVDQLNWSALVNGETDDRKLSFRRKEDVRSVGNETFLGLRNGLVIPSGFNSGQGLNLLLSRVALPYSQMKTFDDLPTPFRTVATDIVAARAHVFEKGALAEAMRATMSIPGLFDPVIDGKQEFVDGGLLNNLPVDLVKQMGADIVIAVYLETDPFDPNKPQTAFGVLARSLSAVIAANEQRNIEAADMLITVNCSGLSTGSFGDYKEVIKRGEAGAQKKQALLAKLSLDDSEWSEYERQRQAKRKTKVDPPQFVEVVGVNEKLAKNVRSYFAPRISPRRSPGCVRTRPATSPARYFRSTAGSPPARCPRPYRPARPASGVSAAGPRRVSAGRRSPARSFAAPARRLRVPRGGDGPHLYGAEPGTWHAGRNGYRPVTVLDVDDVVPAQLLGGAGERAVGDDRLAVADADAGRRGERVQPDVLTPQDPLRRERLRTLRVCLDGGGDLLRGGLRKAGLVTVDEQGVEHACPPTAARAGPGTAPRRRPGSSREPARGYVAVPRRGRADRSGRG